MQMSKFSPSKESSVKKIIEQLEKLIEKEEQAVEKEKQDVELKKKVQDVELEKKVQLVKSELESLNELVHTQKVTVNDSVEIKKKLLIKARQNFRDDLVEVLYESLSPEELRQMFLTQARQNFRDETGKELDSFSDEIGKKLDSVSIDIMDAIKSNNMQKVKELLNTQIYSMVNRKERTYIMKIALDCAVKSNDTDTLKILLDSRDDPHYRATYNSDLVETKKTLLKLVKTKQMLSKARNSYDEIIEALNDSLFFSLIDAIESGETEKVSKLLDAGINPNIKAKKEGKFNKNALEHAVEKMIFL